MKKQKRFLAIISIYTVVYKQGSDNDLLFSVRLEYL